MADADLTPNHSLLLKMPTALANAHCPDLSSLLFYGQQSHREAAPANADAAAAMVEDASLETSSAVVDSASSPTARKRKATEDSAALSSPQPKDCKQESKSRRGKRPHKETEERSTTEDEASKGYIHVRARRGQATDSHSLAERVRRERISERMRTLQALVPGCDKVTGKALVLDEIINYVQSLQNQVEFLSMRIASMSPVLYGFGMNSDGLHDRHHAPKMGGVFQEAAIAVPAGPALSQASSPAPSQATMNTTSTTTPYSVSLRAQASISFSHSQEELLSQLVFSNMCSFQ